MRGGSPLFNDKAEFRLWLPEGLASVRVIVMTPGMATAVRRSKMPAGRRSWLKNKVALVGCTDKPHDQGFIEEYVNVSSGSGKALETALSALAERSKHPELVTALLLRGLSGGQFNYEFVAWKPERVAAFVVNKGGIYYSALLSRKARNVPGMMFIGERDMDSRIWIGSFGVVTSIKDWMLWTMP